MRNITTALFLFVFFGSYANDTLTRAQVYNFGVGDIFDYRIVKDIGWLMDTSAAGHQYTNTYERLVISDIHYSADSLTKYIASGVLYQDPTSLIHPELSHPLTLTNLDSKAAYVLNPNVCCLVLSVDSLHKFFGEITNYINFLSSSSTIYYRGESEIFASGFGVVHYWIYADIETYSTELIYYSGINGRFGIPYTVLSSIGDLSTLTEKINVFPNPNNGKFTVQIPEGAELPLNFSVYDITGKIVKQFVLNDKANQLEMPGLSRGMYFWKATSASKFLEAGKMVVE